ncbi:hypothetical protein NC651_012364 [Populus alba x Populus x berolinensis]|nr:hypothetical protein NC651_012364 [Populus alba x Populus x berolinensis]
MSRDTHVFARMPWFNSWLETDKPKSSKSRPSHLSCIDVPSSLGTNLGYKPTLSGSASWQVDR